MPADVLVFALPEPDGGVRDGSGRGVVVMVVARNSMEIRPISPALGAEVRGIDLAEPLDDTALAALRHALLDHLVLSFPDQDLTPERHKAFAARFGALQTDFFVRGMAGHPEIMEIIKRAEDTRVFAANWHTDVSFLEAPSLGSVLYALEVPAVGGDTLFGNMYLAYEALSPGMRDLLEDLSAVHCAYPAYDPDAMAADNERSGGMRYTDTNPCDWTAEHPVVRRHPETGRKALFVNSAYTRRFTDMTEAESRPLLEFLIAHMARPEFTCRLRWRKGSVAFWDNRCTQHRAIADYPGVRRHMHRVTIEGDKTA